MSQICRKNVWGVASTPILTDNVFQFCLFFLFIIVVVVDGRSFHDQMNEFVSKSPKWWYNGGQGHTDRDRGVLVLLDRCDDPLSPLVHEFTYQAMVNDLLPIEEEKITYETDSNSGKKEKKDVLLNDNDVLWKDIKGMHIADVIEKLSTQIREMMDSGGAALAKDSGASLSLSEMANAMKQVSE